MCNLKTEKIANQFLFEFKSNSHVEFEEETDDKTTAVRLHATWRTARQLYLLKQKPGG